MAKCPITGRKGYRIYYHCTSKCGVRYRAGYVNNAFIDELMQPIPCKGYAELLTNT